MRGAWSVMVDPTDRSKMIVKRAEASMIKFGGYDLDDVEWLRSRIHSRLAFEANLKADPYEPVQIDELFEQLRKAREEQGLTYQDVASPMGSDSSIIKLAEEGRREPKWSNLKLWAWLLGYKIVLVRK